MNKHDWEYTRAEYAALVRDGKRDFQCLGNTGRTGAVLARILTAAEQDGQNLDLAREMFDRAVLQHHCAEVLVAYSDGLYVPKDVIREYVDYFKPEYRAEILGELERIEAALVPPSWTDINVQAAQAYDIGVENACDAVRQLLMPLEAL